MVGCSEQGKSSSSVRVGPSSNLQVIASTAARYLPLFVHVGTQVLLQAPQGSKPATPQAAQQSEDTTAALSQLSEAAAHGQDAQPQGRSVAQQSTADVLKGGSGRDTTAEAAPAESAAARRLFMDRLHYHRMYTLRERAAAICAAAEGASRIGDGIGSGSSGDQVRLCDDIAPPLRVLHARAILPPLKPARQSAPSDGSRSVVPLALTAVLAVKKAYTWTL